MYTEARNDAKLRCLSDAQFRVWFRLLCYAAEQPIRGRIDDQPKYLVVVETAGGDESLYDETVKLLEQLNIIVSHLSHPESHPVTPCHSVTGVTIEFGAFEDRNQRKPADTPERTRDRKARSRKSHRDKVLQKGHTLSHPDVTPVTPCHTQEQSIAEQNCFADAAIPADVKTLPATPDGPPDPAMCPPFPTEGSLIDVKSGSHTLTDADARDLFGKVWQLTGTAKACWEFYEDQRQHAAKTWRAAIVEAAKRPTQVRSVNYLHTIAGDIETGKVKPKPAAKPIKSSPLPEVFSAKKLNDEWRKASQ